MRSQTDTKAARVTTKCVPLSSSCFFPRAILAPAAANAAPCGQLASITIRKEHHIIRYDGQQVMEQRTNRSKNAECRAEACEDSADTTNDTGDFHCLQAVVDLHK